MQLEPLALTAELLGDFARSADRFAARLAPDDQALWRRIVTRAATAAPGAGGQAGDPASRIPEPRDVDWTLVWQPDTLIAPLLPGPAVVRGFRDQPIAGATAEPAIGITFAGRLAAWCESLDQPQQAMVADLLIRAGGDDEDEHVSPLLDLTGRAFSGDLFAPVEFFDYQNAVHTLQERAPVPESQPGFAGPAFPDPIASLIGQHRVAEARVAALETALGPRLPGDAVGAADAPALLQAMLACLDGELEAHIGVEEELLYPRLRQAAAPWDGELIDQMIAGHDQIRRKREELRAAVTAADRDAAYRFDLPTAAQAAAAVCQTVRTHFQSEEELVFRLAPELLGQDTLAAVAREMAAAITRKEADMPESQRPDTMLRGRTTGTSERPARQVAAPVLAFDLPAEIARLHQESGWLAGERDGKTLVKEPDFRIVLTAMKSGTRLPQHEAAARVSIQVLSGQLAVSVHGETTEMTPGHLLVLDRGIPHDVVAQVDSAFLLTLAWPERGEDASQGSKP